MKTVRFFADSSTARNKAFTFRVSGPGDARKCLQRFIRYGYTIRAAWYNVTKESQVITSERIR